jgi:NAD(P)-dependent dehydrogenase (short-subunit alcohol dehydrogenase family)
MTVGLIVGVGGIGAEVARLTRASVSHLVIFDRDAARVEALSSELACVGVAGDIRSDVARNELVGEVCRLTDTLQWAVLTTGRGLNGPITELTLDSLQGVVDTNVVAPMALVAELLKRADWAEGARLVGVGSISARRALPGRAVYGASKAAFETFLISVGVEIAARGILVNVVAPGVTDTPFISGSKPDLERWASERVPVGRVALPLEVASVIAYLLISAPDYLNCSRVVVDGGAEAMP